MNGRTIKRSITDLLVTVLLLTAVGCKDEHHSTMTIELFSDLVDFPGLSVEVRSGTGLRTFDPEDFTVVNAAGRLETRSFGIAERGDAVVTVTLRVEENVVANGEARFALRPGHVWSVNLFRQVSDPAATCFGCEGSVSIDILESARRTPDEKLWIVWAGRDPDSDAVL